MQHYAANSSTPEDLLEACCVAFDELQPEKLEMAYRLVDVVMGQIISKRGGNNFRVQHVGLRKQMRAEGYDMSCFD